MAYNAAVASAPQELIQQTNHKLKWKRCREYLEKRNAIVVQRPGAPEPIKRAAEFNAVRAGFPSGVDEVAKYALMALATAHKIRAAGLTSASNEQQLLVQTLNQSHEAEMVA